MSTTTAPCERPILFSAPMVRALLDGTKTQTRRAIAGRHMAGWMPWMALKKIWHRIAYDGFATEGAKCPYGEVGDRLWVRETFTIGYQTGHGSYSAIPPTGSDERRDGKPFYSATFPEKDDEPQIRWRPSIHMPRWASRITLEITDVRVQRLQDISEEDCIAEGCPKEYLLGTNWYRALWNKINGPGSWDANPLVWAISFKRVTE